MELTEKDFLRIREYIRDEFGISLGKEKKSLIYSRLRSVVKEMNFKSFTEYFDFIINEKTNEGITDFINKVTTNHTYFMREPDHFVYYKNTVLPYIEKKYSSSKDLRLWCAGCSSGEEPYTLQMYNQDYFDSLGWNTDILATDISTKVLTKAVNGIYPNESLDILPDGWKTKYFRKYDKDSSIVVDDIKKKVFFRKLNLMDDFKFKKPLQVIFCRNVMIYFDNETRQKVVKKFYDALDTGGYLFIGHSESLSQMKVGFKYVMPALYRK